MGHGSDLGGGDGGEGSDLQESSDLPEAEIGPGGRTGRREQRSPRRRAIRFGNGQGLPAPPGLCEPKATYTKGVLAEETEITGPFAGGPEALPDDIGALLENHDQGRMRRRMPRPSDSPDAPRIISKALGETISQTGEWLIQQAAIVLAHLVMPGAGHLVVLFFEGKELLGDAAAMVSSDGPVELHIPVVNLPPGFGLEVGVELATDGDGDEDGQDGPRLILFAVPGDGGLLGGWALQRERDDKEEKREQQGIPAGVAVIEADLSVVAQTTNEPDKRAALLRGTAARLQSDLWARPEYEDVSLIVIYDETNLGMWLARSQTAAGMGKIVIVKDAQTGRVVARVVA
jgi:hypothetical protein